MPNVLVIIYCRVLSSFACSLQGSLFYLFFTCSFSCRLGSHDRPVRGPSSPRVPQRRETTSVSLVVSRARGVPPPRGLRRENSPPLSKQSDKIVTSLERCFDSSHPVVQRVASPPSQRDGRESWGRTALPLPTSSPPPPPLLHPPSPNSPRGSSQRPPRATRASTMTSAAMARAAPPPNSPNHPIPSSLIPPSPCQLCLSSLEASSETKVAAVYAVYSSKPSTLAFLDSRPHIGLPRN